MNINSSTKTICLLGHPVKHSFSPSIHNYLMKKYNQNNIYVCFDVEEKNLEKSIEGIKSLGIVACNVTIPHKVNVIKYLDYIEENTKIIGAVNTIKNEACYLKGYNTDGVGFIKSITDKGYTLSKKRVMIIGAGGSSRSIAIELASKGVDYIEIRNRTLYKAKDIAISIKDNFNTKVKYSDEAIDTKSLENIDIIINTTSVGMETKECPIDKNIKPSKDILVCDIVYKPHETEFIKWAKDNNLGVVYGIDMLINQAIYAFYIWTNIKPSKEDIQYIRELYENQRL